jgi:hypothetical protein
LRDQNGGSQSGRENRREEGNSLHRMHCAARSEQRSFPG